MLWNLLVANLIHGLVAALWIAGLRRWAGPLPAAMWADLLGLALVLPPLVAVAHAAGLVPPEHFTLVRTDLWAAALSGTGWVWMSILGLLLAGTAAIFVVEEAWPAWRWRRGRVGVPRRRDRRLDASLERVLAAYEQLFLPRPRGRTPRILRLETAEVTAGLHGLAAPTVVVSQGLLARLDDAQLDAVVAHELAHHLRGGNVRLLLVWFVRAVQAPNPAALVVFRSLVEVQEVACDALAAEATGRPATLASALLESHGHAPRAPEGASRLQRARLEVLRRADLASTRLRIRALLDELGRGSAPRPVVWLSAGVLAAMLWSIA